ncbi:tetratricopeptide repeat protein [Streptosporangium sp. NPDC002721]|uniref:tetratricopeptide repeat protein n=1 Tax=Streptosporangium sp. NPDC002721 TaxID=3366188 RepID=UPI0036C6D061
MSTQGDEAFSRALALYQAGHTSEARDVLLEVVAEFPDHRVCRYSLGVCLNELGEWREAERHLGAVVASEPTHHLAAYELGVALQEQGRPDEAAAAFRQSLARDVVKDVRHRLEACRADGGAAAGRPSRKVVAPDPPPPVTAAVVAPEPPPPAPATPHEVVLPADSEHAAALEYTRTVSAGVTPYRTMATDLDERGVYDIGEEVWSTRTQTRHLVLTPLVATALALSVSVLRMPLLVVALGLYAVAAWVTAVVSARMTSYVFYQRRVDVAEGVKDRTKQAILYASITRVRYVRTLSSYLTNTASLELTYMLGTEKESIVLAGLGRPGKVDKLYDELQGPVVRERRAMKKILF